MNTATPSKDPIINFQDVTVNLSGNTILDGVSASVPRGSCTAIVGPNGAGKTTLLLALLGKVAFQGNIIMMAKENAKQPRMGYVPQRLQIDRGMPITVLEFMVAGIQRMPLWFGISRKHRDRAMDLLKSVKMDGLEQRRLGALSGGELQRVLLALALGQDPELLVLDEPAAGVDFHGENLFCDLLENLQHQCGFTQLMVSHDLGTVTHHANHVICLNRKVAAEGPPRETLTHENLAAIFGIHMGLADSRKLAKDAEYCSASCCMEETNNA